MSNKSIEAIYPLSPLQEGILFHTLYEPELGLYIEQLTWTLHGELNIAALTQAWQQIMDRHQCLRTMFVWEGVPEPLQVVGERVKLPLEQQDWRGLSLEEQRERLEKFLEADRARGFDLARAPLMRLALIRWADDAYHLVWSHHHLLLDGWSASMLFAEVSALYQAFSAGKELQLKRPRPYSDYISWMKQQDLQSAEAFWRETLKGITAPTPLGVDLNAVATSNGNQNFHKREAYLSEAATSALTALARRHQLTLNTIVQGAWTVLLSRYSGEEDVVYGMVVSGRPAELEGVESMVGLFINTIPVRVHVPLETPPLPWLREIQEKQAEARQYEYSPLVQVQGWSEVPRDLPLFESVFVFENFPLNLTAGDQSRDGLESSVEIRGVSMVERANYPLTVVAAPMEKLTLVAFYDERRFSVETIDRLLGHWRTLLEAMASDSLPRIADLPLVTEEERHQLLVQYNDTTEYPSHLLHRLFETQAEENGQAAAVSFNGETWSYAKLNERSNQIAHGLQELGIEPRQPVAIMLESGPVQIAALMGILKTGCPFVCLDVRYPTVRLEQILEDIKPSCLISDAAAVQVHAQLLQRFQEEDGLRVVEINPGGKTAGVLQTIEGSRWFETQPKTNPFSDIAPSDLAYVAFTSGSTGRPKGVMQSHRSFCQFLEWQSAYFDMTAPKAIAQWASITYDASYCEIFGALCFGAQLCMTGPEIRFDPAALVKWVREERISLLQVTPSFCRQLLQALDAKYEKAFNPWPDLERMLLAGEVLTIDLVQKWWQRFSGSNQLCNLYGPTESVLATFYAVPEEGLTHRTIPIGRPIPGRQILILDTAQKLCPVGVKGEIYIRSQYLTEGYWGRPEETRKAFLQNPLHDDYPDPVYRTGDVGRWLPDGNLEFFGRRDRQVKVRGMRVELGDIESTLRRHEAVVDCAVDTYEFAEGDQRLVAYVALNPESERETKVAEPEAKLTPSESQYIAHCQTVYDEIYSLDQSFSTHDSGINLRAWTSSYTNESLPEEDILESVNDTVQRILSLKPSRVLEIGCGTGLLLFRVAPHCTHYCGTDISFTAVRYLHQQLALRQPELTGVEIKQAMAHEIESFAQDPFDVVLMNLVTQHFPSVDYLIRVLESMSKVVAPGGFIFVGGIRNLRLLEVFHSSVQLEQSPGSLSRERLQERVRERLSADKDLVIDPEFFVAVQERLPNIGKVEVRPKGGRHRNEITRFQYDVIMHAKPAGAAVDIPWMDWEQDEMNLDEVRRILTDTHPEVLGIRRVPNGRLLTEVKAQQLIAGDSLNTADEIKEAARKVDVAGVEPDDLWAISNELPYICEVSWARIDASGSFDVVFTSRETVGMQVPKTFGTETKSKPWSEYTNDPLQARFSYQMTPTLRSYLSSQLPEHMVPSTFMFVERLPRTRTGKLDRRALPKPTGQRPETGSEFRAPRTELESLIAKAWQEILGVDKVGIDDHFFSLGGHSLLAMQVINRLRELCSVNLPLRRFFEAPTVAGLAEKLEAMRQAAEQETEKISRLTKQIKQLSEEEIRTLLQRKKAQVKTTRS